MPRAIHPSSQRGIRLLRHGYIGDAAANPASTRLSDATTAEATLFFLKTIPQLFGEEVLTILPFLALLYFFSSHVRLGRKQAVLLSWFATAVLLRTA